MSAHGRPLDDDGPVPVAPQGPSAGSSPLGAGLRAAVIGSARRVSVRVGDQVLAADRSWLVALLAFFIVKQVTLVLLLGPFSGHDEVDHYWYVQRLVDGHGLGVVGEAELPASMAPYSHYVADYPLNSEVIQPPLYHLLLAGLELIHGGGTLATLIELRLVSVLLGVGVVYLTYLLARRLFPNDVAVRVGAPVFIALQPQFSFEAAIVNHDILVILLATLTAWLTCRAIGAGLTVPGALAIGLVGAAGLWTKVSFGLVLPVVAVGLAVIAWDRLRSAGWGSAGLRGLVPWLAIRGGLALVLPVVGILPWFARNQWLYGDPTGSAKLQEISDYALSASTYREMVTSPTFWRGRLDDFWGNYGWREIPWDGSVAIPVYLLWGIAALGLLALLVRQALSLRGASPGPVFDGYQSRCLIVLLTLVASMMYAMLYVGTLQFTQSRFAFPAMAGFGILTMLGLGAWLPARWRWVLPVAVTVGLLALNLLVTIRFVIPYYVGPGGGELEVPR